MSKRPVPSAGSFLSWWVWFVYAVLFAVAIPWYWPDDDARLFLGIPLWAAVSIGVSFLISCYTAWLLLRYWPETPDEEAPKND